MKFIDLSQDESEETRDAVRYSLGETIKFATHYNGFLRLFLEDDSVLVINPVTLGFDPEVLAGGELCGLGMETIPQIQVDLSRLVHKYSRLLELQVSFPSQKCNTHFYARREWEVSVLDPILKDIPSVTIKGFRLEEV